MALLRKKLLPTSVSDLLNETGIFGPTTFDFESDFLSLGLSRIPSANIIENGKVYKIELAAPGLERKDFNVEVENSTLTISSEKEEEKNEEGENFRRKEFTYNSFSRSFRIPENSLPDKIEAKYENGILTLLLPKREETPATPKKTIKVS